MPSIAPCNFCNFPILFSFLEGNFSKVQRVWEVISISYHCPPNSQFMLTGGPPMRWPKTTCRKIYQLILEYEGIEKVHIREHEVFDNMNTDRRQRLVIILSK